MQIDYLVAAESANTGTEGTVNALGMGLRVLTYDKLPGTTTMTLILQASALSSEAGDFPVEIAIIEPDGTREVLVETQGTIPAKVVDERVPTGFGVMLGITRPYRIEGLHRFEAKVGDLSREYTFIVRLKPRTGEPAETPQP